MFFTDALPLNVEHLTQVMITQGVDFGMRLMGAILAWLVGRWLISLVANMVKRALTHSSRIDTTLQKYLTTVLKGVLTVMLILGILGMFGVQTTSFAALLAGAGLAIGTAWGGLLQHFAAGVFMQVLRPFRVGDLVQAGGTNGTVTELGLFTTTITSGDGVPTIIGNNRIFNDNIMNFSARPMRRVDCAVRLDHSVPLAEAMLALAEAVQQLPNVLPEPAVSTLILDIAPEGPLIGIRPYTQSGNHSSVQAAVHQVILDVCKANDYAIAKPPAGAKV